VTRESPKRVLTRSLQEAKLRQISNSISMLSSKGRIKLLPARDQSIEKRVHVGRDKMINKKLKLDEGDGADREAGEDFVYNGNSTIPLRHHSNLPIPKRVPGDSIILKKFSRLN
jgi:hypothetical protein